MQLDCQYYQIPIIIYSDTNLSSTEKLLMSQLISLTLKNGYCFASNEYLANSMSVTKRTISKSLSNLKIQNYIVIDYEKQIRKIYLNKEKVLTKTSISMEEKFHSNLEKKFYHNNKEIINKKNKYKYIESVPEWLENPKVVEKKEYTEEELKDIALKRKELEEMLKEYN